MTGDLNWPKGHSTPQNTMRTTCPVYKMGNYLEAGLIGVQGQGLT